jgi:hypothetical protein
MRKPFTLGKVIFLSLLIWGFASFLLSQTHQNTAPQPQQASGVGRYQVVYSPNARADTFMVDSQTGKTWQFVTFTDIEGDPTFGDLSYGLKMNKRCRKGLAAKRLRKPLNRNSTL